MRCGSFSQPSGCRSSKLAVPAIKAYNKVADGYHQTLQKKGQPLHEGFTIVKVRAARRMHALMVGRLHHMTK